MSYDSLLPFDLPSVCRKKLSIGFDGGRLSSDAGLLLLRGVEKKLALSSLLAGCMRDRRDPDHILHPLEEMLRLRMFAIAAGYEDADDCDALRYDPVFKMAVGRLPESGEPLCSQPTMSRLENAPSRSELARMMGAMVDLFCKSYRRAPQSITLDIDDTCDTVHGHQQLSLFNAHYDERCFLPIHIYEGSTGKPVAMILREGKTPSGVEVRTVLKHVIGRIRTRWPKTHILVRGDSHYGRVEAMEWCEESPGVDYVFGFSGNDALDALTTEVADAVATERALKAKEKVRGFTSFWVRTRGSRRQHCRILYGPATQNLPASARKTSRSGHAVGRNTRMRAAPSTTRAAILIRRRRIVVNSAYDNCERFGTASRMASMSQYAAVCRIRRN
jgi:Transposase DDE domain group 1